jgi:3-hydroxyisobutyrate dehydrogenase-like beta-hydroxyacid dehydrogenase
MSTIAFLGLGAMGSRMATRLLQAGHDVQAWNRSPEPLQALAAQGARIAASPRDAANGADFVISMVTDDAAAQAVWLDAEHGAIAGLSKEAIAIESSTVTPAWIAQLAAAVAQTGAQLIDAPVAGSRPQAQAGQLIFMVGGSAQAFECAKAILAAMGSATHHVGPLGQGAHLKLVVNALFAAQVAVLAELMGFMKKAGMDVRAAADVLAGMPVISAAAVGAMRGMLAQDFTPMFPIDLVDKDLGYAVLVAQQAGAALPVTSRVRDQFAAAQVKALGGSHIIAVAQLFN